MRTHHHILPLALASLFVSAFVFEAGAQQRKTRNSADSTLNGGSTEVITDYKPKLADAVKVEVLPVPVEITPMQKPEMSYTTDPYLVPLAPFKTKLIAPPIKNIVLKPLERCFAKAAFGNYSNLYGEFFYNTLRNRTSLFSMDLVHHSGTGPVKNSQFSTDAIELAGGNIFDGKYNLYGNIGFRSDANRFYATIPDTQKPAGVSDKQVFSDFHINVNFANTGADTGKLRYNFGLGHYSFGDYYKTGENDETVLAKFDEPLGNNHILVDGSFDFMNYKTVKTISRTLLDINAGYDFKVGILRAHAGFKTASESDSPSTSQFHFYPDLRVEADLVEKYLTVLGGITGGLDKTTYRSLAYENPFIISNPALKNVNDKFDLYGGVKGSFSSSSTFLVMVSMKNFHNYYFYMQDTVDRRKYIPVYDTGTTTLINVHGELGWSFMENLNLSTKIDLNSYTVSNIKLQKPYERPGFIWTLTGDYNVDNKIAFGADLFFVGSRFASDISKESGYVTLKPFVDLNAHVSYSFDNVPGLQAFIEANNIFGNQYQVWQYYPVRGFQILGGVKYSFLPQNNGRK